MGILHTAAFVLAFALGAAHGQDGPATPESTPSEPAAPQAPARAPGELPADTAPAARALWDRFAAAQRVMGAPAGPVRSFDVEFQVRTRTGSQSNDLRAKVLWRGPGLVRFSPVGQAEVGRSPKGYWLRDGDEAIELSGRDYGKDRDDIDMALRISQSFARLADPTRLDIHALRMSDGPPADLPKVNGLRPRDLVWLELETADFNLASRSMPGARGPRGAPPLDRVRLGLTSKDLLPRIVHVTPLVAGPEPAANPASDGAPAPVAARPIHEAIYVLDRHAPLTGLRVAREVYMYERGPETVRAPGIPERPTYEVFLLRGELDVKIPDARFLP